MKKIVIKTIRIVACLTIIFGLLFVIVGFVRSFQDDYYARSKSEEWFSMAISGFYYFLYGIISYAFSYIVEAACFYLENNKDLGDD